MKLILLVAFSFVSLSSFAGVDSQLDSDALIRVRYNYTDKQDASLSDFEHQTLINFNYRSGEKYELRTKFLHKSLWGEDSSELSFKDTSNSGSGIGTRSDDNVLFVNEAYISWLLADDVRALLGKQQIELGNGSVFSAYRYSAQPYSFDAAGIYYDTAFALVKFYLVQKADVAQANGVGSDPERNIYLLSVGIKSLPKLLNTADIQIIQDNSQQFTSPVAPKRDVTRYAIQLDGETAGVNYGVTYATESGSEFTSVNTEVATSMAEVYLGYRLQGYWKFLAQLRYHTDSGDSDSSGIDDDRKRYDGYYYDKQRYAGRVDAFEFGNLNYTSLTLEVEPRDKMRVGLELIQFSKSNEADNVVNFLGVNETSIVDKTLGNEADFYYSQDFMNNFEFSMFAGVFVPSNSALSISEDLIKVSLQTTWRF